LLGGGNDGAVILNTPSHIKEAEERGLLQSENLRQSQLAVVEVA